MVSHFTCWNYNRRSCSQYPRRKAPAARQSPSRIQLTMKRRMGVLCILLCIALGISHLLHINILFIFGLLCLCDPPPFHSLLIVHADSNYRLSGLTLIFVEIPLLLRICPTSPTFDNFIRRFTTNYMRAVIYGVMSVIQWLSLIKDATSLIAAAVVLLLAAVCYLIAGLKGQGFVGSKTLGGQGVAQMIV